MEARVTKVARVSARFSKSLASRRPVTLEIIGSRDSMLARRPCQHVRVGHAWRADSDPHDIVPICRQGGDRRGRKILVGEKTQNQAALGNTFSELNVSRA